MPDQSAQPPTQEETTETLARMHLAIFQMHEAIRGSYDVISETKKLMAQADQIQKLIGPPASLP
jgi:hypothetical protein